MGSFVPDTLENQRVHNTKSAYLPTIPVFLGLYRETRASFTRQRLKNVLRNVFAVYTKTIIVYTATLFSARNGHVQKVGLAQAGGGMF